MSTATKVPGTAYSPARDYSPGGIDAQSASFPIIDSAMCIQVMQRIHTQRSRGLVTRDEWIAEQQEIIDRTVPGTVRDTFQRSLDEVRAEVQVCFTCGNSGTTSDFMEAHTCTDPGVGILDALARA